MTKHVLCDELRGLLLERQSRAGAGAADLEAAQDASPGPDRTLDEGAPDPEMEQAIREALTGEALARACGSCDPQTLETFRLLVFENKSYEEIAGLLNTPVGTLHTRVSRVRRRVEEDLRRRHGIALDDLHRYIALRYKLELEEVALCGLGPRDQKGSAAGDESPRPEEA
jgi:DNA-directed RNA polymerase specialized sigma24 family protein